MLGFLDDKDFSTIRRSVFLTAGLLGFASFFELQLPIPENLSGSDVPVILPSWALITLLLAILAYLLKRYTDLRAAAILRESLDLTELSKFFTRLEGFAQKVQMATDAANSFANVRSARKHELQSAQHTLRCIPNSVANRLSEACDPEEVKLVFQKNNVLREPLQISDPQLMKQVNAAIDHYEKRIRRLPEIIENQLKTEEAAVSEIVEAEASSIGFVLETYEAIVSEPENDYQALKKRLQDDSDTSHFAVKLVVAFAMLLLLLRIYNWGLGIPAYDLTFWWNTVQNIWLSFTA